MANKAILLIVVNDSQDCAPLSSGESMTCLSPQVSNETQNDFAIDVSFKMDAVKLNRSSFELRYVRRPVVFPANTTCTSMTGNLFTYLLHIQVRETIIFLMFFVTLTHTQ